MATQVLGVEGGEVATSGARVQVPAGAVGEDTTFSVVNAAAITSGEFVSVGQSFKLSPAGQTFSTPVTLILTFDPSLIPAPHSATSVVALKRNDSTGAVTVHTGAINAADNTITFSVNSFSTVQCAVRAGVDVSRSSVSFSGTSVPAPGPISVQVEIRNPAGQPIPNYEVRVERSSGIGASGPSRTDAAGTATFQLSGQANTTGTVVVRAGPQGQELTRQSVSFLVPPLPTPTNLSATVISANQVRLDWTDTSTGETGFQIERSVNSGPFLAIASLGSNVQTHVDSSVTPGTTYTYRLQALGSNPPSSLFTTSAPVTVPTLPAAPTGLGATPVSPTRVDLSWTDNANDETGYRVERRDGGGVFAPLVSLPADTTTHMDTSAQPLTSYDYRVVATKGVVESSSSSVGAATPGPPSPAPSNVMATVVGLTRVRVTWTQTSPNETSFELERRLSGGGAFQVVRQLSADSTSAEDFSLAAATSYDFRVVARNVHGTTQSATVSATTPSLTAAPSGLAGAPLTGSQVRVTWTDNATDETSYRIERRVQGGLYRQLAVLGANSQIYDDTSSLANTTYAYRVVAVGPYSEGSAAFAYTTAADTSAPAAPSSVVAHARPHRITLCWEDNASDETGYRVERSAGGAYTLIGDTEPNATSFRDKTIAPGTVYTYRVSALGGTPSAAATSPATQALSVAPVAFALASKVDGRLYRVRTDNLTPVLLGTVTQGVDLAALAPGASPNEVRVLAREENRMVSFLLDTNAEGAAVTLDRDVEVSRRGLAVHPEGFIMAVTEGHELRFAHPTSGATTLMRGITGVSRVVALACDARGTLFALGSALDDGASERLYWLDQDTGAATEVGIHGAGDLVGLTAAPDGFLYALDSPPGAAATLYRVDPATGEAQALGSTGVVGANGIQAIPIYNSGGGPQAPHVDRVIPPTLISGGQPTQLILTGSVLGAGTNLSSLSNEVQIQNVRRSSTGSEMVADVQVSASAPNPVVLQVANPSGTYRFEVEVLHSADPLAVAKDERYDLAGSNRLASLRVCSGGLIRGVGLYPLGLACPQGAVRVEGTIDVSGFKGFRPLRMLPAAICGRGGNGGPGGGGGGGGGSPHPQIGTDDTVGGEGGWGYTGGAGGGGAYHPGGRGGMGASAFGSAGNFIPMGFASGGNGGAAPAGYWGAAATGGQGDLGGGGGGTGFVAGGTGGRGGPGSGQAAQTGLGGGAGAQHNTNGAGGGGGSYGTAGLNGRRSGGSFSGGGPCGLVHGNSHLGLLSGGSGGGGGSGRGGFEGLAGGGGGGGGALYLRGASITVSGSVVSNGGDANGEFNADGESGAGSGGALVLQAPTVNLLSGAQVQAKGGSRHVSASGYRGDGGDGRIRVDAQTLQADGVGVSQGAFAALTSPAVGFFGSSTPVTTLNTPASPQGASVSLSYSLMDADTSRLCLEVEVSINGGAFVSATPASGTDSVNRPALSATGLASVWQWDALGQLGTGTYSVVARIRSSSQNASPWATSGTFTVTN